MRRAAHVDANQAEIVNALVAAGCSVQSLAGVGAGCPDLVVGIAGVNVLIEIKNPERDTPSQRRADRDSLDAQRKWSNWWRGQRGIARTSEEALDIVIQVLIQEGKALIEHARETPHGAERSQVDGAL